MGGLVCCVSPSTLCTHSSSGISLFVGWTFECCRGLVDVPCLSMSIRPPPPRAPATPAMLHHAVPSSPWHWGRVHHLPRGTGPQGRRGWLRVLILGAVQRHGDPLATAHHGGQPHHSRCQLWAGHGRERHDGHGVVDGVCPAPGVCELSYSGCPLVGSWVCGCMSQRFSCARLGSSWLLCTGVHTGCMGSLCVCVRRGCNERYMLVRCKELRWKAASFRIVREE